MKKLIISCDIKLNESISTPQSQVSAESESKSGSGFESTHDISDEEEVRLEEFTVSADAEQDEDESYVDRNIFES